MTNKYIHNQCQISTIFLIYMKNFIKKTPIINYIAKVIYFSIIEPFKYFSGSNNYWMTRYANGGTSGAGSYNKLAEFKARIINDFVANNKINSIIEFGCGDGNQLKLSNYDSYIGFDISKDAINQCKEIFTNDKSKIFKLLNEYSGENAQLVLSLDVIYHLIEDDIFFRYMELIFDSSTQYVIIYSSNTNIQSRFQAKYVKHRKFSHWIELYRPNWKIYNHIVNEYHHPTDDLKGSFADFYIYKKIK